MPHSIKDSVVTSSQLGEHKDQQSLWVAVHGKVYDLTSFAEDHPGGIDVLKDSAGTDATESFDYAGHTDAAITTMQRFLVGRLEGSENEGGRANPSLPQLASRIAEGTTLGASGVSVITWVRSILLIAILGLLMLISKGRWGEGGSRGGTIESESAWSLSNAHTFSGGLMLASSVGLAGLAFLYSQFSKTLEHEKDVFSYPSVIPRRAQK